VAATIPRPRRAKLLTCHGALAPRGCCREGTVAWPGENGQSPAAPRGGANEAAPAVSKAERWGSSQAASGVADIFPPRQIRSLRPRTMGKFLKR
jgi:hypothetical protein